MVQSANGYVRITVRFDTDGLVQLQPWVWQSDSDGRYRSVPIRGLAMNGATCGKAISPPRLL